MFCYHQRDTLHRATQIPLIMLDLLVFFCIAAKALFAHPTTATSELPGVYRREARLRFPNSMILGYYRPETGVHANPPETDILVDGDWLIGLCADQKSFTPISDSDWFFGRRLDQNSFTLAKKRV